MSKTTYIGIDIGGTKILLQTFDTRLKKLKEKKVKTAHQSRKAFLKQVFDLIDEHFESGVKGIGLAVPGIVNKKSGALIHAPHLPVKKSLPLKRFIQARYKCNVHVDNDINAFLAAEYAKKSLSKYKNVLAVMVGTGVGGAAIVNGQMLYGKDGYAGEMGHMVIAMGQKNDTLEKRVSGAYNKSFNLKDFAIGLSNLNLIFNPDAIVLGGSVYRHHFAKNKKQIGQTIKDLSLDKSAPKLIDASTKTSVPKGAVLLLR